MKLISCSIANFGGLSGYSCQFDPELTVVTEPNGFGKTTLAEFIRAMFYGFPRAGRALEKNRRKKYLPWQGGRFGGNLIFEHEGIPYRIERSFGERPSGDTFALYDLRTNQRSTRFSSDIGSELFQLDADSFERSTYLPQIRSDLSSFSTDSIRAKLGDLVQDTNDVNNFETARTALQRARSSLIPYRGNGGAVFQAQSEISNLEEAISGAKNQREELERRRAELARQREVLDREKSGESHIREKIRLASQAERNKAVIQRYEDLCRAYLEIRGQKEALAKKYPCGFPSMEETDNAIEAADQLAELRSLTEPSKEYLDAVKRCENEKRFHSGVPSEDDFKHYNQLYSSYANTKAELERDALTADEEREREELEQFFSPGVPDDETISQCRDARGKLSRASAELSRTVLDPEESALLARLKQTFASGVPSDDTIADHKERLEQAGRLREENQSITVSAAAPVLTQNTPNTPNAVSRKNGAYLVTLVLGILSILGGGALLLADYNAAGGCLIGLGFVLLIVTVYFRLKDMVSRAVSESRQPGPALTEEVKQRLRENDAEIRRLESSVKEFADRYISGTRTPADKLQEIQNMAREYKRLTGKEQNLRLRRQQLENEIADHTRRRAALLAPYYGTSVPDEAESDLEDKKREYQRLQDRREKDYQKKNELGRTLAGLSDRITAFLSPYFDRVVPDEFDSLLRGLEISCSVYRQDQNVIARHKELAKKNALPIRNCRETIASFAEKYGLNETLSTETLSAEALSPEALSAGTLSAETLSAETLSAGTLSAEALREIKNDLRRNAELEEKLGSARSKKDAYFQEKQSILLSAAPDTEYDMKKLEEENAQISGEIEKTSREILALENEIKRLQETADRIPELEDKQALWTGKLEEGRKNAELLDAAIDFLTKAKESLSTSYLSSIQAAFSGYFRRLAPKEEQQSSVYIDSDLGVTLDKQGKAREMEYFSLGQADSVMLCMRFALVDALFKDANPFIILDDPFVNFDDAHTAAAISLLKSIAADHQIIYLTCNSSRSIR